MKATNERRHLPLSTAGIEIRSAEDDTQRFSGYAAVFNTRAAIGNPKGWGFYEEIAPGAFSKTLQESDARMLIDHDTYYVVSRASAGSLALREDERGLVVDSAMDDDLSYVRDLKANLRNGNITGMSFGFQVVKDDWATERSGDDEYEVRTIREIRLVEVSAVTFPAYSETEAELRDVASALTARGDGDAMARRAELRPELSEFLPVIHEPDPEPASTEPGESTRYLRMRGLAVRYSLPLDR